MRWTTASVLMVAVAGLVVFGTGCTKSESCNVTISYVLEPSEQLPEGLSTLAILDAGVDVDGSEDDDRAKKWAKMSADLMERPLELAAIDGNQVRVTLAPHEIQTLLVTLD